MVTTLTAVGLLVGNAPQRAAAQPAGLLPLFPTSSSPAAASTAPSGGLLSGRPGLGPPPSAPAPAGRAAAPSPAPAAARDAAPGPGRAWTLTASKLVLHGSRFHGYAPQQVAGKTVQTLHFTVTGLDITDLVQRGLLLNGTVLTAAGAPASMSTVTKGPIELYSTELTGTLNVLGYPAIPITLSPNGVLPPNLDGSFLTLPDLTLTNVVAHNIDLNGGILKIPGAKLSVR